MENRACPPVAIYASIYQVFRFVLLQFMEKKLSNVFPQRFLPAPVPVSTSDNGLKIDPLKGSFRSLFQSFYLASTLKLDTCYDEYCSSRQEGMRKMKEL